MASSELGFDPLNKDIDASPARGEEPVAMQAQERLGWRRPSSALSLGTLQKCALTDPAQMTPRALLGTQNAPLEPE